MPEFFVSFVMCEGLAAGAEPVVLYYESGPAVLLMAGYCRQLHGPGARVEAACVMEANIDTVTWLV